MEGQTADDEVSQAVLKCLAEVPTADASAIEAHMTLWRAYSIYASTLAQTYDELGLSVPRFNMLRWLYHSPSLRRSMSELGVYLVASAPNVTRMVKALEEAQWVRRIRDASDRRKVLVQLTPKGRQDFEKMLPRAVRIWGQLWAGVPAADRALVSEVLTRLRVNLTELGDPGGDGDSGSGLLSGNRREDYERIDLPS